MKLVTLFLYYTLLDTRIGPLKNHSWFIDPWIRNEWRSLPHSSTSNTCSKFFTLKQNATPNYGIV